MNSFAISAAGMGVERLRVEVAAMNLANANTVSGTLAEGFQPLHVVVRSLPDAQRTFGSTLRQALAAPIGTVQSSGQPARRVLEPGHPLADAQGFVSRPAVDTTAEMVSLMSATRAYEANVVAMNAARSMALKALEIGS